MTLKIRGIEKSFGGVKALDKCTLEIKDKKITAVIGPNGSGKSTLFNVISKIVPMDRGGISLGKTDLSFKKDWEIAKDSVSRTFQDVRLFRNLTIKDHFDIAMASEDENLLASIFKKEENREKKIRETLETVDLEKPLATLASNLSYGQRKLLDLAVALAKPHSILMLDEPVAGVNPHLRAKVKDIIRQLNKKGETILLIEHDMNFVMDLADYIFVMDEGKIIAEGTPRQVQRNRKVLEAYLGE